MKEIAGQAAYRAAQELSENTLTMTYRPIDWNPITAQKCQVILYFSLHEFKVSMFMF